MDDAVDGDPVLRDSGRGDRGGRPTRSAVIRLIQLIIGVMVGTLLTVIIIALVSPAPGHRDLYEQDQIIQQQLAYMTCVLLIPPDERIPVRVAECQMIDE